MDSPAFAPAPTRRLRLLCLCAAWCELCGDYAPVFERVARTFLDSGVALEVRWIDIEDEADLVGDYDVETFPTILVLSGSEVRFAGPVTPQPETLNRLLRSILEQIDEGAAPPPAPAEAAALAVRLADDPGAAPPA